VRNLRQNGNELIRLVTTLPRRIRQSLCRHVWSDIREYPGGERGRECLKCGAKNMVLRNLSGANSWAFMSRGWLRNWSYIEPFEVDGMTFYVWYPKSTKET